MEKSKSISVIDAHDSKALGDRMILIIAPNLGSTGNRSLVRPEISEDRKLYMLPKGPFFKLLRRFEIGRTVEFSDRKRTTFSWRALT